MSKQTKSVLGEGINCGGWCVSHPPPGTLSHCTTGLSRWEVLTAVMEHFSGGPASIVLKGGLVPSSKSLHGGSSLCSFLPPTAPVLVCYIFSLTGPNCLALVHWVLKSRLGLTVPLGLTLFWEMVPWFVLRNGSWVCLFVCLLLFFWGEKLFASGRSGGDNANTFANVFDELPCFVLLCFFFGSAVHVQPKRFLWL